MQVSTPSVALMVRHTVNVSGKPVYVCVNDVPEAKLPSPRSHDWSIIVRFEVLRSWNRALPAGLVEKVNWVRNGEFEVHSLVPMQEEELVD